MVGVDALIESIANGLNFLLALVGLGGQNGQCFDVKVRRVVVDRTWVSLAAKELWRVCQLTTEGDTALGHEEKAIEHLVHLARGLMDRADDGLSLLGQISHRLHDGHGHVGVEAACGLVGKKDRRVRDDFGREGESSSLTARYSLDAELGRADQGVFALLQIELVFGESESFSEPEQQV